MSVAPTVRQCVMLVGGAGSRLGELTRTIPKPMMPVAGQPFLAHLLVKAARQGFERVLLLAGYRAEVIGAWLEQSGAEARLGLTIDMAVEATPLGTGGALPQAAGQLDEAFLLVNGDTWFDFAWRALADDDRAPITLALREVPVADRYEMVQLDGDRVARFVPRSGADGPGLINGGVYRIRKSALPAFTGPLSLEADVLPAAAARGELAGVAFNGAFIDIGLPESLAAAQSLLSG